MPMPQQASAACWRTFQPRNSLVEQQPIQSPSQSFRALSFQIYFKFACLISTPKPTKQIPVLHGPNTLFPTRAQGIDQQPGMTLQTTDTMGLLWDISKINHQRLFSWSARSQMSQSWRGHQCAPLPLPEGRGWTPQRRARGH